MAIRKYKPTTPGRRGSSVSDFAELTRSTPEKSLLVPIKKTGGRNNQGRVTTRHIGGGHKPVSYTHLDVYKRQVIDSSAKKIVDTVTRTGAKVAGPVPLPTEKNVYCVIRSPHKYKDSREHFEMRTHKRLIDIVDPTPKAVDSLMRLDLPADVNIEIKL